MYQFICISPTTFLYNRPDLLNPGQQPQARLELIDDSTLVTDLAGLYREGADVPIEMTVGELREQLSDSEQYTEFCLPKFQRVAVERALSQALSLIQVCDIFIFIVFLSIHYTISGATRNRKVIHRHAAAASLSVNEEEYWSTHSGWQTCSGHGLQEQGLGPLHQNMHQLLSPGGYCENWPLV